MANDLGTGCRVLAGRDERNLLIVSVTLAIESSCDESSVALVENGRRVLANLVFSQEQAHAPYGGVVPELAARAHLEKLPALVRSALAQAGLRADDVDQVAVTRGPGLVGCLLVGVGLAQGLGAAWGRPVTGVNHLWGHVYAALLARPDLEPPLLALVVSGAHSDLVRMPAHGEFHVVGRTRDDAAGEAFDKAARTLGLGYPGGPALDREARRGDWRRQPLPVPVLPGLEYSFSGLKTALLYRVRDLGGVEALDAQARADLAAAFERSVVEALLEKLGRALDEWPVHDVVVCGGVAANTLLRQRAAEALEGRARLTIPPLALCTDNAAMIAAAAPHAPRGAELRADPSLAW
jgi:N6-L-threonylcarbamoyladenine synthase